jgi:Ca2+-binding EF-hand superfamily protein
LFADADLAYFDDNKDGRVSRDEFINKPSPFFQRFDRNHDCKVTPDELAGNKPAEKNRGFGKGGQQRHF